VEGISLSGALSTMRAVNLLPEAGYYDAYYDSGIFMKRLPLDYHIKRPVTAIRRKTRPILYNMSDNWLSSNIRAELLINPLCGGVHYTTAQYSRV
jgi:hypothetical protein